MSRSFSPFVQKAADRYENLERKTHFCEELGIKIYFKILTPNDLVVLDTYAAAKSDSNYARVIKTCQLIFQDKKRNPLIKPNELDHFAQNADVELLTGILEKVQADPESLSKIETDLAEDAGKNLDDPREDG